MLALWPKYSGETKNINITQLFLSLPPTRRQGWDISYARTKMTGFSWSRKQWTHYRLCKSGLTHPVNTVRDNFARDLYGFYLLLLEDRHRGQCPTVSHTEVKIGSRLPSSLISLVMFMSVHIRYLEFHCPTVPAVFIKLAIGHNYSMFAYYFIKIHVTQGQI